MQSWITCVPNDLNLFQPPEDLEASKLTARSVNGRSDA